MFDLSAALALRADLVADLANAWANADDAYTAYVDGSGDFADRCHYDDCAEYAADTLRAYEVVLSSYMLALEV